MRARQIIEGASFGPDALRVMGQAFDEAWIRIAGKLSSDPTVISAARANLATAILAVASENSRDVSAIKNAALDVMRRKFRIDIRR